MEKSLKDNFGRTISYLRLAVTDRCNLSCVYCKPGGGTITGQPSHLLSRAELERLVRIFVGLGITKVRITGGEPFMRNDLPDFLAALQAMDGLSHLAITSNGTRTGPYLEELQKIGICSLNLSLDTLSTHRYQQITSRNLLSQVMDTIEKTTSLGIPLKINTVVLDEINTDELLQLASLAKEHPLQVRFIELMPAFNGGSITGPRPSWNVSRLREFLASYLPEMIPAIHKRGASSQVFNVRGFRGTIGLIGGYSRIFCNTCNKVRVTPYGVLKNCLYDDGSLNLRTLLRSGVDDETVSASIKRCIVRKPENGFVAEKSRRRKERVSMSCIGG